MRIARTAGMYALLTLVALVFVGPFLILLSTALKPAAQAVYSFPPDIVPRPPVLDWLREAWTAVPFPRYLANSFLYVGIGVPLYVAVSALAAYPLAVMRFRGRTFVFFVFLSTMFLPAEVMLIPRFLVVAELGLVDTYAGVILPGLLSALGILLLRQAFQGIPRELVDAARIDGCGESGVFWHVMLPAARPTLVVVAIFGFITKWNAFIWPLIVLKDTDKFPATLGIVQLAGASGTDVRAPAAGTLISIIPVIVFFVMLQRHILEGMRGAVKG